MLYLFYEERIKLKIKKNLIYKKQPLKWNFVWNTTPLWLEFSSLYKIEHFKLYDILPVAAKKKLMTNAFLIRWRCRSLKSIDNLIELW